MACYCEGQAHAKRTEVDGMIGVSAAHCQMANGIIIRTVTKVEAHAWLSIPAVSSARDVRFRWYTTLV